MDGVEASCSTVESAMGSGAAAQCPDNACSGFNQNGDFVSFVAGVTGASGYFTGQQLADGLYEWNGQFYAGSQWTDFLDNQIELAKEAVTDAI